MVADWAVEEFESLDLGDKRRSERVVRFVSQAAGIGQSNPDRTRCKADLKAVYRLADNPDVDVDRLFDAHHQAARKRCGGYPTVYLAQDSTEFDLTKPHRQVAGAGPLAGPGRVGFFYHPLYAVAAPGIPLGVVDQVLWARDPATLERSAQQRKADRQRRCFEEKESCRWLEMLQSGEQIARSMPQTHFIALGDSESDIGELLAEAAELPDNYDFILRQCRTQKILAAIDPFTGGSIDRVATIDEALGRVPWRGEKTVPIGDRDAPELPDDRKRRRKAARTAREATLRFRSVRVHVAGPQRPGAANLPATWINVVEAAEVDPPAGEEPVRWVLLTTLPVDTVEAIDAVLEGYRFRWPVELYFKTLKGGLHIEKMKYQTMDRYVRAFSMLAVVAWRVEYLKGATRHDGDSPCTAYFAEHEWMAIMLFVTRGPVEANRPPTTEELGRSIATLGGYIDKPSQGPPGSQTLWRGMSRFATIVEAFAAFRQIRCGV